MQKISEDIGKYMQFRELVTSFLLTMLFLLLSFVSYTRFSTTEIMSLGEMHTVHISYYGFPFQMIGILNPLTDEESHWVWYSESGSIQLVWSGFLLNFILYFLLAFLIIYLVRRYIWSEDLRLE